MYVNVMTKPVQGQQFIRERNALTNWYWIIIVEFISIFITATVVLCLRARGVLE
jgi:hypothetical protein